MGLRRKSSWRWGILGGSKMPTKQISFIIPGRGYRLRARHAQVYKENIKNIARKRIRQPLSGEMEIKLEYLYSKPADRLDGDNLLKTICDALKGVAYRDDSQIAHHDVKTINMNSSFTIRGVPLTQQIGDLFANQETFTIIRLRAASAEEINN